MAHRCLDSVESSHNNVFESLLDRAREVTLLAQDNQDGYGEGLDLAEAHILIEQMRDEAKHDLVEIVNGTGSDVMVRMALQSADVAEGGVEGGG